MIISLIVAMDENGGIGKGNQLPWHLPSDLHRFKKLTMGHHLAMGRKTYETIGKQLPGRVMIVITHQRNYISQNCLIVHSLEQAITLAEKKQETELFIIGGGEIFNQAIDIADKIYLTTVHGDTNADVYFLRINPNSWKVTENEKPVQAAKDEYSSDFKVLIRLH